MSSSGTHTTLDREAVARVDASDLVTDILALPEHLRDALWKVESAGLTQWDSPGGLVVAGMGGSAIGGALARAILGDHASRPLLAAQAYGLPPWTTPDTTVLCASYSGDTEETLACYEAAGVIGARRVVVTSGGELAEQARADGVPVIPVAGGLQPRAAVGYMTVAALEVAALCGVGPALRLRARRGRRAPRGARRGLGPGRARRGRAQGPGPRAARLGPGHLRRRADDAARLPLEDPDQRERQAAGLLGRAAGGRPQRDRRLGQRGRARALRRGLPRRRRHAPAGQGAHRADRPDRRRRRAPAACTASSRAARPPSSACSRSCCWATSSRSTWPCCAASTRRRCRPSSA